MPIPNAKTRVRWGLLFTALFVATLIAISASTYGDADTSEPDVTVEAA